MPEPTARRLATESIVISTIGIVLGSSLAPFCFCIPLAWPVALGLVALMPAVMAWRRRTPGTGLRLNPCVAVAFALVALALATPFLFRAVQRSFVRH